MAKISISLTDEILQQLKNTKPAHRPMSQHIADLILDGMIARKAIIDKAEATRKALVDKAIDEATRKAFADEAGKVVIQKIIECKKPGGLLS